MKSAAMLLNLTCMATILATPAYAEDLAANSNTHFMAGLGLGIAAQTNNIQGTSAGGAAQLKIRANGRAGQMLYDERASLTYNVLSEGSDGPSTDIALRDDMMFGRSVQNIRNTCSFYGGISGYARGEVATNNNGAANSLRTMITPETGLACDVSDVLVELSPIVGLGLATNSSSGFHRVPLPLGTVCGNSCSQVVSGVTSGGTAIVGGGVLRLSVGDRLHLAARAAHSIPNAVFSGGATGDMTMAGADIDLRISDRWSVGVTADGMQYAADPTPAAQGGSVTRYEGQLTGVATAIF